MHSHSCRKIILKGFSCCVSLEKQERGALYFADVSISPQLPEEPVVSGFFAVLMFCEIWNNPTNSTNAKEK